MAKSIHVVRTVFSSTVPHVSCFNQGRQCGTVPLGQGRFPILCLPSFVVRIERLLPRIGPTTPVPAVETLRHDSLKSNPASVFEDRRSIPRQVLNRTQRW